MSGFKSIPCLYKAWLLISRSSSSFWYYWESLDSPASPLCSLEVSCTVLLVCLLNGRDAPQSLQLLNYIFFPFLFFCSVPLCTLLSQIFWDNILLLYLFVSCWYASQASGWGQGSSGSSFSILVQSHLCNVIKVALCCLLCCLCCYFEITNSLWNRFNVFRQFLRINCFYLEWLKEVNTSLNLKQKKYTPPHPWR